MTPNRPPSAIAHILRIWRANNPLGAVANQLKFHSIAPECLTVCPSSTV